MLRLWHAMLYSEENRLRHDGQRTDCRGLVREIYTDEIKTSLILVFNNENKIETKKIKMMVQFSY